MRLALILFISIFALTASAQNSDEELAAQYYSNGEYEKAEALYKNLFKTNPNSIYIYENYLNTLIALGNQNDAESLVKKQIRKDKNAANFKIDLGYVYEQFEEYKKADNYFDELTSEYLNDESSISYFAQALLRRQYTDRAIFVFEKAIQNYGLNYYWTSLINLYRVNGDFNKATDLGLKVLLADPRKLNTIQFQFSLIGENESALDYMQSETLSYAQSYPDNYVFDELLMALYLQQKKYSAAFRQAKAMDLRNKEDGRRLIRLAEICVSNKAYQVAELCYTSVIDKGTQSVFYVDAEVGLLNTLYLKTTSDYKPNELDINNLVSKYESFLSKYGYSTATATSMKRLAELYLFYTHKPNKGISVLNELIKVPRLSPSFLAETKLMLGDAYLIIDDIWEAKLLYGQVDKEFKEEALGQEAKFRNARLSYFTGDFDWAKDQLEILKTATSQLISNNALELSLLIQDNTGFDSTEAAMKDYAHAEFLFFQNKLDECLFALNLIPFNYEQHSLTDEVLFLKARLMERSGDYSKALMYYEEIYESYSTDILADNAIFRSAQIQLQLMNDPVKAKELFEKLILEYTSSLYVVESRKQYELLKNNSLQ
jgi:predicted Zn-dependent protease